jgi:hypothetical protein
MNADKKRKDHWVLLGVSLLAFLFLCDVPGYAIWCTQVVECRNSNQLYSTQKAQYAGTCENKTGGPWNSTPNNEFMETCTYNCKNSGWWDVCCSEPSCAASDCGTTVQNECGYSRTCPACAVSYTEVMKVKCPGVANAVKIAGNSTTTGAKLMVRKGGTNYKVELVGENDTTNGSCVKARLGGTTYRLRKM